MQTYRRLSELPLAMPIAIFDYPEPLTEASSRRATCPILIESDAYHQLVHEFRRYCKGDINGCSFLIAGHRGSGKTTLVLSAIQAIDAESRQQNSPRSTEPGEQESTSALLRPLLVPLQGPSMLPNARDESPSKPSDKEELLEFGVMEMCLCRLYSACTGLWLSASRVLFAKTCCKTVADLTRTVSSAKPT